MAVGPTVALHTYGTDVREEHDGALPDITI